jgi:hypothetical protein
MIVVSILLAILIVVSLLFLAFWIPSERASLDKNLDNIDLKGYWKRYLGAFVFTSLALVGMHLWLDRSAYISLSDIPIYYATLFAVSPAAKKIYRGMKKFILRR